LISLAQGFPRLSRRAAQAVRKPGNTLELSALSISEIAIKNRSGKLDLPEADLLRTLEDLEVRILPYTREHALRLFALPWHHTDPFVTSDEAFRRYASFRVIW
jgi:PIN domain nuclease of toxin-antitoxin system